MWCMYGVCTYMCMVCVRSMCVCYGVSVYVMGGVCVCVWCVYVHGV